MNVEKSFRTILAALLAVMLTEAVTDCVREAY